MDIKITVRNKLPICGDVAIVCNNSDYTVIWELDEEWSGYDTKTMRTAYQDGTYTDTVFTGNTVSLPVVTVPGRVKIGLYAGDIRTSRAALISALPSITTDGGAPAEPPDDVYNQIMELIKQMETVSPEDIAKAVEDYLTEHPAAAASMRVEGGYIQFSADGKTWENVIALADLKGAPGKDGAGMDVTGAAVGQIAKISAVDEDGKPTAWVPVDVPSSGSGELKWIKVASVTTEEEITVLSIGTDADGREISGYNAVAMVASLFIPSDSTQASATGSVWTYPAKHQVPSEFRAILNIANWKTTDRGLNVFWCGLQDTFYNSYTISGEVACRTTHIDILSGLYMYIHAQGDHLPVGTKVNIAVLSKGWNA